AAARVAAPATTDGPPVAPPPAPVLPGVGTGVESESIGHVGRYALKSILGKGGLGTVYAAWDPLLSRTVALKTLHIDADPASRAWRTVTCPRSTASWPARRSIWRPNRWTAARSTAAATSTRWASCSTNCWWARSRSRATPSRRSPPP